LVKGFVRLFTGRHNIDINKEICGLVKSNNSMIYLPLGVNDFEPVAVNKIAYVEGFSSHINIVVIDGKRYDSNLQFKEMHDFLDNCRREFRLVDKKIIANINLIQSFDVYMQRVYFNSNLHVTIRGTAMRRIKSELSHLEDIGNKFEYAPVRGR